MFELSRSNNGPELCKYPYSGRNRRARKKDKEIENVVAEFMENNNELFIGKTSRREIASGIADYLSDNRELFRGEIGRTGKHGRRGPTCTCKCVSKTSKIEEFEDLELILANPETEIEEPEPITTTTITLNLESDTETDIEELQCVVCMENRKCINLSCNHVVYCNSCAVNIEILSSVCPICREPVTSYNMVYI